MVVLSLHCCVQAWLSLVAASGEYSPVAVNRFLIWWLLRVKDTGSGVHGLQQLWDTG